MIAMNRKSPVGLERVCVLMATYNPSCYLIEQIDSIICQQDVTVDLIIRDDASTNLEWVKKAKEMFPQVTFLMGNKNLGVIGNVWELIRYATNNMQGFKYYAYSDQDDVWMVDKLITGIRVLEALNDKQPNLYYSNLLLTDKDLNPLREFFPKQVVKNSLYQGLSHIFEFACTSIFNRTMLYELNSIPKEFMQFDHLIYYMAIIRGTAFFDDNPHIYYRQHGNNVSGNKNHNIRYFLSKVSLLKIDKSKDPFFKKVAKYLLKYFENDFSDEEKIFVEKVATYNSIWSRINLILDKRFRAGYQPRDFYRLLRLIVGNY